MHKLVGVRPERPALVAEVAPMHPSPPRWGGVRMHWVEVVAVVLRVGTVGRRQGLNQAREISGGMAAN